MSQLACFTQDYPRWRPELAKALDPKFYTVEYIDSLISSGAAYLFTNARAAILVEIKVYPTGTKDVHGLVAAGTLGGIVDLVAEAEEWGRKNGCAGALINSREGWARIMKKYGYEPHQVAVRKVL